MFPQPRKAEDFMDKILGMLGLANRAGKVFSGGFAAEKALTGGDAKLVLISSDAKKNTVGTFVSKCEFYHVPLRYYSTKEELGHALGKGERSCLAVTDEGFARSLLKLLDEEKNL